MNAAHRYRQSLTPSSRLAPVRITSAPGHYFFGYYDKQPWDLAGRRILAHRTIFHDRFPEADERADIGYIDVEGESSFVKLAETTAWNWQQGAQLQWLRDPQSATEHIIFNDRRDGHLVAVIHDLDSNQRRLIDAPIYVVDAAGEYGLSLNYARLFNMRMDYGIAGVEDPWRNVACPTEDGVFRIDLQNGARELIVSIADVAKINESSVGSNAKHWINHVMFNPSGTRFCFLHRFYREDGILYSRLFTADKAGGNRRLLFEGMVSHYCWKDERRILAWAGRRKILGGGRGSPHLVSTVARRCLKPVYYGMGKPRILMQRIVGDSYYLIEDVHDGTAERFAYGQLTSDGHCTMSADGRWVLTDGYTDSQHRLPLFLYNLETAKIIEVGRFATPKDLDGPLRVDLHPRFNRDGTKICIDSAMDGTRQMYVIDVSDIVGPA